MSAYSWALCLEELPLLGFAAALLVAFADGLWSFPSVRGGGGEFKAPFRRCLEVAL